MRRRSAGILVVLLAAVIAAGSASGAVPIVRSLVPVKVTPASPRTAATVTVSFAVPASTESPGSGTTAVEKHTDAVEITGPRRSGCVSFGSVPAPAAPAGTTVHVKLAPEALGGQWCAGRFTGEVSESTMPDCSFKKREMCPMYEVVPQIIGKFRFTVAAR